MKLISFIVPCYNSQDYMEHCISTLLNGGDEVEILIVNDGSKDRTAEIADSYEAKYPGICRAIHQENKGHGGAVNTGVCHATGIYTKVVDSDDWVNVQSLDLILNTLRDLYHKDTIIDMVLANYVYEKEGQKHKTVINYRHSVPIGKIFNWNQAKHFRINQFILMHSVIYRTELLKNCGLKLPEHTFYVDNIYVYHPLPYVKSMYYIDTDFYRYFIGRDDQSVNEKNMIARIDQQLFVNRWMIDYFFTVKFNNKYLRRYMIHYLKAIMTVSSVIALRSETEENLRKKQSLWRYLYHKDKKVYYKIRLGAMGQVMNLPGRGGRKATITAYKLAQKIVGFN
ncbi:MAG: glycosyltransferase family 2 protein [Lachnospiraceae bacterium]|nr:glycosyltransferase family 2 protein [Lachnospiraceae bacterium]